jgi:hypothetical protein
LSYILHTSGPVSGSFIWRHDNEHEALCVAKDLCFNHAVDVYVAELICTVSRTVEVRDERPSEGKRDE